jgi:hypothetical protein
MKTINLNTFVYQFVEEVRNFEENQLTRSPNSQKTMEEWVDNFLSFAGYVEDEDGEEFLSEEFDDDLYYGQDYQFQDLVNRRKYRSFRDDDSY